MAILGGRTSCLGLRAVGLDAYKASEPSDAPAIWESLPRDDYAVIYVTEPLYQVLLGSVAEFPPQGPPVIIVIPAVAGSRGMGLATVKSRVEKAVGADIELHET